MLNIIFKFDLHCIIFSFFLLKHSWLFGKWKGKGSGTYPTIKPFEYLEEVEFCNNGTPFTSYK